jgi:ABC-type methionine transport system permease subunit
MIERDARQGRNGGEGSVVRDLLIVFGAFVGASAIAGALGAANLGTALSFGQIAVAISVVYVIVKR